MKQPLPLTDYVASIDFSRVTPLLRASFACYKTASEKYTAMCREDHQQTQQNFRELGESRDVTPIQSNPGEDALAFIKRMAQRFALQKEAWEASRSAQQGRSAELCLFARTYVQANERLTAVYKGLQERGELTREDERLFRAICKHDLHSFRRDQEELDLMVNEAFSALRAVCK